MSKDTGAVFIERFTEVNGQVVDVDILPAEVWTCAILTYSSLLFLISFAVGVACGILVK